MQCAQRQNVTKPNMFNNWICSTTEHHLISASSRLQSDCATYIQPNQNHKQQVVKKMFAHFFNSLDCRSSTYRSLIFLFVFFFFYVYGSFTSFASLAHNLFHHILLWYYDNENKPSNLINANSYDQHTLNKHEKCEQANEIEKKRTQN